LNKICSDTDPININYELYFIIRNIPTKSKIIWENVVDIKKVFEALIRLKNNNSLYPFIILPHTHNKLYLEKLNNPEFHTEQMENDTNVLFNDECEQLNNSDFRIQEIKSLANVTLNDQSEAMLTQKNENDSYYEQYTIYPLYEKKPKLRLPCIKC